MKQLSRKSGFTLVELMIASAIFVVVMVLTTAIFSIAASYNGKLSEMRRTSLDGRKVMEQLSRDIRLANGSVTLKDGNAAATAIIPAQAIHVTGEIILLNCYSFTMASCKFDGDPAAPVPSTSQLVLDTTGIDVDSPDSDISDSIYNANALLILNKDNLKAKIYFNVKPSPSVENYEIIVREVTLASWPTGTLDLVPTFSNPYSAVSSRTVNVINGWNRLNSLDSSIEMGFAGYWPAKSVKVQQPYVEFGLRAQTWNYDTVQANSRAQFDLKTTVETRDYN